MPIPVIVVLAVAAVVALGFFLSRFEGNLHDNVSPQKPNVPAQKEPEPPKEPAKTPPPAKNTKKKK